MEARMVDISALVPYENNPRKNAGAVEAVADSIKRFGFLRPIVVNKEGVILSGHTRRLAALELGLKKVPVVVEENLSETEEKAYRLADNRTGEFAGWDYELLEEELSAVKIGIEDFNFEVYGLNPDLELSRDIELDGGDLSLGLGISPLEYQDNDEDDNDFLEAKREFYSYKIWPTESERVQIEACRTWYKQHHPRARLEEELLRVIKEEFDSAITAG